MSLVATRSSWPRPAACAIEAILSTTTFFIAALPKFSPLARARVEDARQCQHLRIAMRLGRRPFAGCFAIGAFRGLHQRERRLDAFDKGGATSEQDVHLARDPALRGEECRLDVAAHRVEVLALVDEIAVRRGELVLDAGLTRGQHQL